MPTRPGSSTQTDSRSEGSLMEENQAPVRTDEEITNQGQVVSIGALPDDILLPIFEYGLQGYGYPSSINDTEAWLLLAHVCRRWRSVIFGSPRRLGLRLCCTPRKRSRYMLDIWPAFPLVICGFVDFSTKCADNIIAALEYSDRVCHIDLWIFKTSEWEECLAAMQQPFPELTDLRLSWGEDETGTVVVPNSFLGGFAPRLERFQLVNIPFPGLPKLLLSATHLVDLDLQNIPHSGYISPDAMVAALSTLTSLEYLRLEFISCPDLETRRLPPSPRSVLPVLKFVAFEGASEYLEDLVTDIDAPQLKRLLITVFNDIVFDTPHWSQFIGRTPILNAFENAHISLGDSTACVAFRSQDRYVELEVTILCKVSNWQLSFVEQVCTSCLPFLSTLKDLYVYEREFLSVDWKDEIEYRVWRELLYPFTAVKNIYLSDEFALHIGPALQELVKGRAATEVLPTLENIFLEGLESSGHVQEGIGQFVAARQVSSHPVTVSDWEDWRSYY